MAFPALTISGVLPPFHPGSGPADRTSVSPYRTDMVMIANRFASTPHRRRILSGLLDYRQLLHDIGIRDGFQWIDGSYLEDCEKFRKQPPNDIDLVTFAERPSTAAEESKWQAFVAQYEATVFDPAATKKQYSVDAYFVDLSLPPSLLVSRTRYWFGLFSHQRTSMIWKGMLEVPLGVDDSVARAVLAAGGENATQN
jgi:hypothetical protein